MNFQFKLSMKQEGAVLIVGLIMMLLLTVIGLASIRGSDLQERMAGNMRDRNLAFQSAEAGLRAGELISSELSKSATPRAINTNGYYENLNLSTTIKRPILWEKADWETSNYSIKLADDTVSNVADQPRYVIEKFIVPFDSAKQGSGYDFDNPKDKKTVYRVTSRGIGGTTDTEVILQSTSVY